MLSDVMAHFGLTKSLRHVDDFETEHHRQLLKDLKARKVKKLIPFPAEESVINAIPKRS